MVNCARLTIRDMGRSGRLLSQHLQGTRLIATSPWTWRPLSIEPRKANVFSLNPDIVLGPMRLVPGRALGCSDREGPSRLGRLLVWMCRRRFEVFWPYS